MGLFSRNQPDDHIDTSQLVALARDAFARGGIETTVEIGDDLDNPQLIGQDGLRFPLYNLILNCREAPRRKWDALVTEHVRKMLGSRTDLDPEQLDAASLRRMVRTRLIADIQDDVPIDFSYARAFAPGLITALCIDYPETVMTIGAEAIAKLALSSNELYSAGQTNTNAEPHDEHNEVAEGVWLIGGGSLFIASKAADIGNLIRATTGPAPHGLVFAVPHRNVLLYTIPQDLKAVTQVGQLLRLVAHMAFEPGASLPGGLLSSNLYFWHDDSVEVIGGRNPDDGALFVNAGGNFGEVMNAFGGNSPADV